MPKERPSRSELQVFLGSVTCATSDRYLGGRKEELREESQGQRDQTFSQSLCLA